jgi:hypothetical protein
MDRAQLLNDGEEAMRLTLDGRQSCLWTAMPGIVTSVNFEAMTCEVQPAIQGTVTDENGVTQSVNLPLLVDVPIVFPSAGGFLITLPLKADDEILVVFASRCIDAWWQSGGIQRPMEARLHDLSDGFAIPGPRSQSRLPAGAVSSTSAQLRNDAGTTYIEIDALGKIKLVSPSEIDLIGPVKVTGALTFTGSLNLTGNLNVTGTITATGEITAVTTPLHTHTHISGTPTNPTGPPVP